MEYIFGRRNGVQSAGFEFCGYFVCLSIWCSGSLLGAQMDRLCGLFQHIEFHCICEHQHDVYLSSSSPCVLFLFFILHKFYRIEARVSIVF